MAIGADELHGRSLMIERDDWGQDPQVSYLRRVFAQMEAAQKDFLGRLGISPLDDRLRRGREEALHLFEKAWLAATRRRISLSDEKFGLLYQACLAKALQGRGMDIPRGTLAADEIITAFLSEDKA